MPIVPGENESDNPGPRSRKSTRAAPATGDAGWQLVHDAAPGPDVPAPARKPAARKPAAGKGAPGKPAAPAGNAPVTRLRDDSAVKGLGSGESVIRTYRFDGDNFHLIRYESGLNKTYRMVREVRRDDTVTFNQIIDGEIRCDEIRAHVSVNKQTRQIGTEHISVSYKMTYIENTGDRQSTGVNSDEINKDSRPKWAWLTRLGIDAVVKSRKYPELVELAKAINFCARSSVTTVRVINQTGIIIINDVMHYANATGEVIGPNGKARTDVVCEPYELDQYQDIGYTPTDEITAEEKTSGVSAILDLFNGHEDLGITGLLTGQLIGSLLSGTKLKADNSSINSVSVLTGPTGTGKTAYTLAVFASQSRSLYGEMLPAIIARITPNKGSGGATGAGIFQNLKTYSGILALLDDAIKAKWEFFDKRRAHDQIIEKTTGFVIGGATPQSAGFDLKLGDQKPAASMHLPISVVFTVEDLGATGSLMNDSTYNRNVLIWWDVNGRCSRETFQNLITPANTMRRNNGLSVILNSLLNDPGLLSEGYEQALDFLRGRLSEFRTAKSYARSLAGIYVLESACNDLGITNPYPLATVLPHALRHALMLENSGTNGGDEIAISDPVEATREAFRILSRVKHGAYATAPIDKKDRGKGVIPVEPVLPDGQEMTIAGWLSNGEGWAYPASAIKAGEIKSKRVGGRDSCPWPWRMECSPSEWADLDTKLTEINRAFRHHIPSRQARKDALIDAGVMRALKTDGVIRYQIDWIWITGVSDTIESDTEDAESDTEDAGDDD